MFGHSGSATLAASGAQRPCRQGDHDGVLALVLDRHTLVGVLEVGLAEPLTFGVVDRPVDEGQGEPAVDEDQAQLRFLRRATRVSR